MVFALDRAGLVGADGATHAGMFDIAFTRCIPNMSVLCPADEQECRRMLTTAYQQNHPVTVRYPRGSGVGKTAGSDWETLPWGKAHVCRSGQHLALLAFGPLLYEAWEVAERLNLTLVNMRWVKPLDTEMLLALTEKHEGLVTLEEGARAGGAGAAVLESLQAMSQRIPVLCLGFDDQFIEHGDPTVLMQQQGLTAPGIQAAIEARWPGLSQGASSNLIPLRKAI